MSFTDALDALEVGEPVVIPTDTVYGLAVRADAPDGVAAIVSLKGRPADIAMVALVAGVEQADELVDLGDIGALLAEKFWPGALTIVAPRRSLAPMAVGDRDSVGVRCPASRIVRDLAGRVGPLAVTSANLHGEPPPTTAAAVARVFPSVAVVVDGGKLAGAASTVVSVLGGEITVVREGPISAAEIEAAADRRA